MCFSSGMAFTSKDMHHLHNTSLMDWTFYLIFLFSPRKCLCSLMVMNISSRGCVVFICRNIRFVYPNARFEKVFQCEKWCFLCRVLLCLKRALRIANAAQLMASVARGSSGSVTLFVEILNKSVSIYISVLI